jgi:hypothetical protein
MFPILQHSIIPLRERRPNPPAWKPYGLEAGPEANGSETPNWIKHVPGISTV